MAKLIEEITSKMSAEAAKEFRAAIEGMTILNNASGEYVSKAKADAELAAEKKLNSDLAASVETLKSEVAKGGEAAKAIDGLEARLKEAQDTHKREIGEMKTRAESDKKTAQVKSSLLQAGALDPDLAFMALGIDLSKLDYDDKGNLVGHSDRIKALQEEKTFLFNVKESRGTHLPGGAPDKGLDALVEGAMAELGYKTGAK